MENLPFTFVESEYFVNVLALYDESVKLSDFPKADTITDHIVAKFQAAKDGLRTKLAEIESINLTVDLWTSPNGKAILGITGHWLDSEWILHDVLLDVMEMRGVYSGKKHRRTCHEVIARFKRLRKTFLHHWRHCCE